MGDYKPWKNYPMPQHQGLPEKYPQNYPTLSNRNLNQLDTERRKMFKYYEQQANLLGTVGGGEVRVNRQKKLLPKNFELPQTRMETATRTRFTDSPIFRHDKLSHYSLSHPK